MIFAIIAVSLFTAVIGLILYARWNYGTLESLGFTVVKPLHILFGNTANMHKQVGHLEDIKRFKKYGPVYGVYEGREPQVHVSDAELIKCIMVKDYEHFKNRREIDFGSPLLNEMPDFLPYDKWKAVRSLLTPAFTASKLKMMSASMKSSLEDFEQMIKKRFTSATSEPIKFNLRQEVFTMLTDMIARCVFSIKIENKDDANNYFVKTVKTIVEGSDGGAPPTFMRSLAYTFPILNRFNKTLFDAKASDDFVTTFKPILDARRKSGVKEKDVVDLVIEWMDKVDTPEFKKNNITELTIMCQALVFFFAGQDQISSIVSYAILSAANDKKVEDKIIKEMDAFLEKHNGKITYDNMSELTYLQACLMEATRLVPFFTRAERICTKDWEKDGIKIKKGITVIFPIWAANRNPEYFPDPEIFDPERFMPANKEKLHPYAFTSFGHGPKNCIGMRFSTDAMLMTAAHLYKDFRFKIRSDSDPKKMKYYPGVPFFSTPYEMFIDILSK